MTSVSRDVGTAPQGLDLDAFADWYDSRRPGEIRGPLTGGLVKGGKSNLTYRVTDGESEWVVRRPPLGHVQATAHDMAREFTVMSALALTDVPVPRTYALCEDPSVIGASFYVMEFVHGVAYRQAEQLRPLGPQRTGHLATSMIETLARLHAVEPASVGLERLGRPEGFLARQVRRWGRQLDGSRSRPLPDADTLLARLASAVGELALTERAAIVHGDYRLDNLLVAEGQVRGVIDWEMATIGDPLTDVALMLVYEQLPRISPAAGIATASTAPGYPSTQQQLASYERAAGRTLGSLDFHLGLAFFKLAVILEGIHYRHLRGHTIGEGFGSVGQSVEPLLAAGLAATTRLRGI